jgi:drug/metabolite transporter (DMT)-like permease
VCIAFSPIFVRVSELGPIATAWWRLALALIPLALLFESHRRTGTMSRMPRRGREHLLAAVPGLFLAGDLATWHVSLHMTSVANATLLVNMSPVVVTLAGWALFRRPITRLFSVGLVVSIAGILVLNDTRVEAGHLAGDAVALVAAAFYGGYILALGRAREAFDTAVIMLWSTTSAAACTLPLAIASEPRLLPLTLAGWATLVGLAWLSHAGGQSLIAFSLAWLPAAFSAVTLLIQPVVAAILAWMLLGERLTAIQIAGGFIVLAGIAIARQGSEPRPRRPA